MTDDVVCLQVSQAVPGCADVFCLLTVQVRRSPGCEEDGQVCEQPDEAHGQQGAALRGRGKLELKLVKTNKNLNKLGLSCAKLRTS